MYKKFLLLLLLANVFMAHVAVAQLPVPPENFATYSNKIPHGTLTVKKYFSSVINAERQVKIYTPPHYNPAKKYNVLYLLHGIGGDIHEWTFYSHPENILDNLYALGKLEPMIMVFPNGRAKSSDSPGENMFSDENIAAFAKFETELINDLIPFIEKLPRNS